MVVEDSLDASMSRYLVDGIERNPGRSAANTSAQAAISGAAQARTRRTVPGR
jgi:hypothetical protein